MSARWIQKDGSTSKNRSRKRSGGKKKSRSTGSRHTKNSKKSSGPAFRKYVEDPEEVAAYTNRDINLDPDPENQEKRIAQLMKDFEKLEEDLAPLTDEEKKGMRDILEE